MTTEIMQEIMQILDKKMISENRKVLLFMDNAPCHPDILQEGLKNIKIDFFPKNTTSRLQDIASERPGGERKKRSRRQKKKQTEVHGCIVCWC